MRKKFFPFYIFFSAFSDGESSLNLRDNTDEISHDSWKEIGKMELLVLFFLIIFPIILLVGITAGYCLYLGRQLRDKSIIYSDHIQITNDKESIKETIISCIYDVITGLLATQDIIVDSEITEYFKSMIGIYYCIAEKEKTLREYIKSIKSDTMENCVACEKIGDEFKISIGTIHLFNLRMSLNLPVPINEQNTQVKNETKEASFNLSFNSTSTPKHTNNEQLISSENAGSINEESEANFSEPEDHMMKLEEFYLTTLYSHSDSYQSEENMMCQWGVLFGDNCLRMKITNGTVDNNNINNINFDHYNKPYHNKKEKKITQKNNSRFSKEMKFKKINYSLEFSFPFSFMERKMKVKDITELCENEKAKAMYLYLYDEKFKIELIREISSDSSILDNGIKDLNGIEDLITIFVYDSKNYKNYKKFSEKELYPRIISYQPLTTFVTFID